jgi:serine/threonine protein kinase
MQLCINPSCPRPDDPDNERNRFCESCGSDLLIQGRYQVMRLLSDKTGFGKIYEAYERGTPKILKVLKEDLNGDAKAVELFEQEAAVLGQLNHPGIPKVDGYFQYQTRNGLILHCIVMEKIEGSNLEQCVEQQQNRPISQEQAIAWLKQLAVILQLVHAKHYLHRDIKPSNIMLRTPPQSPPYPGGARGDELVLIDFGTAREVTRTYLAKRSAGGGITAIVSSGYTAPEQANGNASTLSDFFALGRTFVFLLTGRHPMTMYDSQNDVLNWRSHTSNISPSLLNLIDQLMARNPSDRPPNTQAILQRLEAIDRQQTETLTETVNVLGTPKTQRIQPLPPPTPPLPQQERQRDKWPVMVIFALLLVPLALMSLLALAVVNSNVTLLPTPTQSPERKGKVDYFPYVEGRDSQGRTAEFNIAVLSIEYKWQLGSSFQIKHNDQFLTVDSLQSSLEQEGIKRIMENPNEIISVGTASCEGSPQLEERRAFERAQQIQLLVKKMFGNVSSVQGYRLLNLGQFRKDNCQSNQDETSYQRSLIIIGVRKQTPGVLLDEALRERLEKKPFADFKLEDYSLGSPDKFKTIPSRL